MDVVKTLNTRGNVKLTTQEFIDFMSQTADVKSLWLSPVPIFSGDRIVTLFGKRVVHGDKCVILWERCEYCGGHSCEKGLYDYNLCASCGAPIT
jgi:hypothetical protein